MENLTITLNSATGGLAGETNALKTYAVNWSVLNKEKKYELLWSLTTVDGGALTASSNITVELLGISTIFNLSSKNQTVFGGSQAFNNFIGVAGVNTTGNTHNWLATPYDNVPVVMQCPNTDEFQVRIIRKDAVAYTTDYVLMLYLRAI